MGRWDGLAVYRLQAAGCVKCNSSAADMVTAVGGAHHAANLRLSSPRCLLQRKLKAQRRELQSLAQIQAEVEEEEAEKEAARLRRKVGTLLAGAGLSSVGACRGDGPVICCLPARSRHRLGGQARVLQEDGSQRGTDRTAAVCSACLRLVHPYHSVAAAPSSRPASLLSAA